MKKRPISLIIDDPAPGIHLYRYHMDPPLTEDGRRLLDTVPNRLLFDFCDIIERRGIKGKFSVVPMAGNRGSLKDGFDGVTDEDKNAWIDTVRSRVMPNFAICSEILSHHHAVDPATGNALPENEQEWVRTHSLDEVTEYVTRSLRLLAEAGLTPTGVTSPWSTGIEVEPMYHEAISRAFDKALGQKDAWYFLHCYDDEPGIKPIVYTADDRRIVQISASFRDHMWQSIHCADSSDEYAHAIADELITEDGKGGSLPLQLEMDNWPVMLTHWQSLYSNGLFTGLRALDLVGERIERTLGDRVEWVDFTQLMTLALADKTLYTEG